MNDVIQALDKHVLCQFYSAALPNEHDMSVAAAFARLSVGDNLSPLQILLQLKL